MEIFEAGASLGDMVGDKVKIFEADASLGDIVGDIRWRYLMLVHLWEI